MLSSRWYLWDTVFSEDERHIFTSPTHYQCNIILKKGGFIYVSYWKTMLLIWNEVNRNNKRVYQHFRMPKLYRGEDIGIFPEKAREMLKFERGCFTKTNDYQYPM